MSESQQVQNQYCGLYIMQEEKPQNYQQIQKQIEKGSVKEKVQAIKSLIINIIHDSQYPRMIMTIFNYVIPIQKDTHKLKKILFYYWEIVEKLEANGKLKDEFVLVCNSIRNDLLHSNEYIRGRTLKMLTKVQIKGILEPLTPSILQNLEHTNAYVRRNAVSLLYSIYLTFGDDLVPEIDKPILKLLTNEQDLSTKRNAFLLLFLSNQQKALEYLSDHVLSDLSDAEHIGDILQQAILELLRKSCKVDPDNKSKLIKAITKFQQSKSPSVMFECANTLMQISASQAAIKLSITLYINLLTSNTDNNVKLIVLDKLNLFQPSALKFVEDQLNGIIQVLKSQSLEIRKKALSLIKKLVSNQNVSIIVSALQKEMVPLSISSDEMEIDYLNMLLSILEEFLLSFPQIMLQCVKFIKDHLIINTHIRVTTAQAVISFLKTVLSNSEDKQLLNNDVDKQQQDIIAMLSSKLSSIHSFQIIKVSFWAIGKFGIAEDVELHIKNIQHAIGSLPLIKKKTVNQQSDEIVKVVEQKQVKYKTVILADGTYGQEIVDDQQLNQMGKEDLNNTDTFLRQIITEQPYVCSLITNCLLKLLYKIKEDTQKFNQLGAHVLLLLCQFVKLHASNTNSFQIINVSIKETTMLAIQMLTNPEMFIAKNLEALLKSSKQNFPKQKEASMQIKQTSSELANKESEENMVMRQPDDPIFFRHLKTNRVSPSDMLLGEDEDIFAMDKKLQAEKSSYTKDLTKIIQLTGYMDPIYSEALVNIHKYDIEFDILLVNRTDKHMQNLTIEFSLQGDLKLEDKPISLNLNANCTQRVKTSIKLVSAEAGLIFASINYENRAGITEQYMITNEICIDIIDFIYPAVISNELFIKSWRKYEWENRILVNTSIKDPLDYICYLKNYLKMECLSSLDNIKNNNFFSCNLYAKTKLDEDFLVNISIERHTDKITGYVRIRSKTKGIVINLGDRIKKLQQK